MNSDTASPPIQAKRHFGQNFLTDPNLQTKLSDAFLEFASNYNDWPVVELGPGKGDITKHILKNREVIAFEIDKDLIPILKSKYPTLKLHNLDLYENISKIKDYTDGRDFVFFSNLPYNIASRFLIDFCIQYPTLPAFCMTQKEVATKLRATNKFTLFGGFLNMFYEAKILFDVKPGSFTPRPKITSAVFHLTPNNNQLDRVKVLRLFKLLQRFPSKTIYNNSRDFATSIQMQQLEKENLLGGRLDWNNYLKVIQILLA